MIILIMSAAMLTACGGAGTQTEKTETESSGAEKPGAAESETAKTAKETEKPVKDMAGVEETAKPAKEMTEDVETAKTAKDTAEAEETVKTGGGNEADPDIILGDERADIYLPLLDGKRVALFTNQTGIVGNQIMTGTASLEDKGDTGTDSLTVGEDLIPFGQTVDGSPVEYGEHIVDALVRQEVDLTVIFVPEHGLRGKDDAGAQVLDSVDEKTDVPAVSLYGSGSAYPSSGDMDRFDTLVIDIQDVGLRYYTYYITMYYLMDACAAAGKEVIILDRPNPNGFYVDGPILKDEFVSGVGILPIPVVHGMTLGELAQMINGEGWLSGGKDACLLTVVPCENYTHQTKSSLVINPSPNLKDMRAVYLYASTCYFENTAFSIGRGTAFPFDRLASAFL